MEKPFFNWDDTSPQFVKWINLHYGFLIAALPSVRCEPVLILLADQDKMFDTDSVLFQIKLAQGFGLPRVAGIFLCDMREGCNAPVTRVKFDGVQINAMMHASLAEEEWVLAQIKTARAYR